MFDHSSRNMTEIKMIPESATSTPPVRIEINDKVFWLRPSNVLRIETLDDYGEPVRVVFNDGGSITWRDGAGSALAEKIAAALWPAKS